MTSQSQQKKISKTLSYIRPKDIALGRGGIANNHVGNISYRKVVKCYQAKYLKPNLLRKEKGKIVKQVRIHLKKEGYRFMEKKGDSDLWVEASDAKQRKKVVQALREGAPDLRTNVTDQEGEEEEPGIINTDLDVVQEVTSTNTEATSLDDDDDVQEDAGANNNSEMASVVSLSECDEEDLLERQLLEEIPQHVNIFPYDALSPFDAFGNPGEEEVDEMPSEEEVATFLDVFFAANDANDDAFYF